MWWQAAIVAVALGQAQPKELTEEQASDLFTLMERLHEDRMSQLTDWVSGGKKNARSQFQAQEQKLFRSELKQLKQKDEAYIPQLERPFKLGDFGYPFQDYRVLAVVGPNDVVIYQSLEYERDVVLWLTDYDTSKLSDDDPVPIDKTICYATETRSFKSVGGGQRTVPMLRPLDKAEVLKLWSERRKEQKKKKK